MNCSPESAGWRIASAVTLGSMACFLSLLFPLSCASRAKAEPRQKASVTEARTSALKRLTVGVGLAFQSHAGADLPWEVIIEPPDRWSLNLGWANNARVIVDDNCKIEIGKILSTLEKSNVIGIPEGRYGLQAADAPLFRINIESDHQVRNYVVGSLSAVRSFDPGNLDYALRLLEAWCSIEKELNLPSAAFAPGEAFEGMVIRFRREYDAAGRGAEVPKDIKRL